MRRVVQAIVALVLIVGTAGAVPARAASADSGVLRVSLVLTYKYATAPVPSVAGDENYNGPTPDTTTTHEGSLDVGLNLRLSANARVFAVISPHARTGEDATIEVERLYLDLHDLGMRGLDLRVGRDAIRLGQVGLLLDEVVFDEDRRDGFQAWIPIGPARLFAFYQWALDDHTTTRRVWGGRVEAPVFARWTLGVNYRADSAADADMGTCPGTDCAAGSGFSVDLDGTLAPGVVVTLAYASYTQAGDTARVHFQAIAVIDLAQTARVKTFEPVVTLWYKTFDPYTMPGGVEAMVPRGNFSTPDDFRLFNINDNLTALGARLQLRVARNVVVFGLGEWGGYKDGGPRFSIFSAGVKYRPVSNTEIRVSYNTYAVDGGIVTTSAVSGFELANVSLYFVETSINW
jgi:hypothetical protein